MRTWYLQDTELVLSGYWVVVTHHLSGAFWGLYLVHLHLPGVHLVLTGYILGTYWVSTCYLQDTYLVGYVCAWYLLATVFQCNFLFLFLYFSQTRALFSDVADCERAALIRKYFKPKCRRLCICVCFRVCISLFALVKRKRWKVQQGFKRRPHLSTAREINTEFQELALSVIHILVWCLIHEDAKPSPPRAADRILFNTPNFSSVTFMYVSLKSEIHEILC